jgi:hypothetical protein
MTEVPKRPIAPTPDAPPAEAAVAAVVALPGKTAVTGEKVTEIGGPKGPEPTRYGDWERKGRCIDF